MAASASDVDVLAAVVAALAASGLEAIVVGATAAVLHGAPLMTADIDLLVRDTPRNRQKFEAFARALGASKPRLVSDLSTALTIEGGPVPIDLLLDALPGKLSFAAVRSRAARVPMATGSLRVASLADVIRSKAAAGRPKDRYHLEVLRQTVAVREALEAAEPAPAAKRKHRTWIRPVRPSTNATLLAGSRTSRRNGRPRPGHGPSLGGATRSAARRMRRRSRRG